MNLNGKIIRNRYRIEKKISEDSLSTSHLAYDLMKKNRPIVFKFFKNSGISKRIEDIIRFRMEVQSVSEIDHENIIKIYDVGEVIEFQYAAMEYNQGRSLAEIIAGDPIPVARSADIIMQVCRGLVQVHSQNIIHKELNPSNIIIDGARVVLSGFGLSHLREFEDVARRDEVLKSFRYMAPEQCRILNRGIDERSDLYSAGVIFYRLLAGREPFDGGDLSSIIHKHIALVPDNPCTGNADVPEILGMIVMKLLEKEPENRYQSAAGLLNDLEKFAAGHREFIPGLKDRAVKLSFRTKMMNRERELNRLVEIYDRTIDSRGSISFITGEAGSGKTRLIEEFKSNVYSRGGLLLEGRCSIQSNKNPYEPFKEIMSALIMNFSNIAESKKEKIIEVLRDEFQDLGRILIKLNPAMKEILGDCPPLVALEPERENKRFHMVISQFFQKASLLLNGMVMVIDDMQWTDEGTLNLLSEISDSIGSCPLSVIGAFRNEEVTKSHGLKRLHKGLKARNIEIEEIHLDLFSPAAMHQFISSLLAEVEGQASVISSFVQKKSNGNPFFAIEIVKKLIDENILVYKNDGWNLNRRELETVAISETLVDVILNRINKFDEREKSLLSYAAVIGKKFNIKLLFRVGELDTMEVVRIIDKAIDLQLLVDLPVWGDIGWGHDRIREVFYNSIRKETRKNLHLAVGNAIEELNKDNLENEMFDLAHHYIEGGDVERSIIFAYPAGIMAMNKYANEEALKYFKLALKLLEHEGQGRGFQWLKILTNMSKVYLNIGNYDEAIEMLQKILPIIKNPRDKSEIYSQICSAYYKKGDWAQCEENARNASVLLGEWLPSSRPSIAISILKELLLMLLVSIFPGIFINIRSEEKVELNKRKAKFFLPVLWSYILSDIPKFVRTTIRSVNMAQCNIGKSVELGMALGGYGALLMSVPMFKKAIKNHERSLAMREEVNDTWGIAQSLQWMGYCYQWMGDYRKSIDCFAEAVRLFKKVGDVWETGMSFGGQSYNYILLSDYSAAKKCLDEYYEIVSQSKNSFGLSEVLSNTVPYYFEQGDVENALITGQKAYEYSLENNILLIHCRACADLGTIFLDKGEIDTAISYLAKARDLYKRHNLLKQYTIHLYPTLAEAHIAKYRAGEGLSLNQKIMSFRKIGRLCRTSLQRTKRWATYHGISLMVAAKYHALRGKAAKAERFFQKSIAHYKKVECPFFLGRCYYEYGLYLSAVGNSVKARKHLESAYKIFNGIGSHLYTERISAIIGLEEAAAKPASIERLIDNERLLSIIALAKEISHISNIDDLLCRTLAKAVEITGAQRGCILIANDKKEIDKKYIYSTANSYIINELSQRIVRDVLDNRTNIIIEDARDELRPRENGGGGDIRSILCVPIKERDRILGVCYLDNSLTSGVFTEKEADLLITFLSHVAYAIEIELIHQQHKDSNVIRKHPSLSSIITEKIKKAVEYINENYTSEISREGLAAHVGIHHDNLGKYFKLYLGKKMTDYINELRVKDAVGRLQETGDTVIDIAFSVGFGSLRTFNKVFREIMNKTPADYRKHNR
ncbi:MAG: AAA family ATPase [Spirochaetes bacterium]|nr:AAA family ATPase [Spirochaetota bacterium]